MRKNYSWTKQECVDAIVGFYNKNNRTPRSTEFKNKFGLPSRDTMEKVFNTNSIVEMFKQCGLERTRTKNRSEGTTDWEFEIKPTTTRVRRYCDMCGNEYSVTKSQYDSGTKCCSRECYNQWQTTDKNKGFNNPNFTSVYISCDYCGKEFIEKQYKIKGQDNHFCCKECRKKWFSEVYSQREDVKERSRINAVKILENGLIDSIDTTPQKIIIEELDKLNIRYKKEKGFTYYSVDIFLLDYKIPIEIMGTFWHCDHREYPEIKYSQHVDRIKKDKAKHSYILNNYKMEILYLWEADIYQDVNGCINMILDYIKDGFLLNYHSFNYDKNTAQIPYMGRDISFINSITNIVIREKRSMKQLDKWTKFNCEHCGEEKEELISHYNKKQHHFCSRQCCIGYYKKKKTTKVKCANCGKEFLKKNSDIKRSKTKVFCCCRECRKEYNKNNKINFKHYSYER